jgi:hypothetical protein
MAKAPPPQGIFPPTAASAPEPSIEAAIGAVLGRESLANERKLAYVRAVVVILSTLLDVVVFFFPEPLIGKASVSPAIALFSMGASVLSIILVVLLRSRRAIDWLPWLQVVVPMFDGVLLGGFITNIHPVLGQTQPMILTNITAFCCLLAVSGGMRLRRRSVALTTAVALANFSYAAVLFGLDVAITLFAAFTIFGTGFIARWMADIVRRQIQNEAGRVMMERFLPKPVVEAAFETPLELLQQPRLCQVTVMVTDLRNFTHFAENLAPVEVLKFLNHLQGFQSTIVEAHGGWVNKFMGMACWRFLVPPMLYPAMAIKPYGLPWRFCSKSTGLAPWPLVLACILGRWWRAVWAKARG